MVATSHPAQKDPGDVSKIIRYYEVVMKLKKEYLILVIVIAALALYLGLRDRGASQNDLPQPEVLESSGIDRIKVTSQETSLELVKKDEQWFLEPQGFPADKAEVTNMLNIIAKLKLTALVSESGNYERYGLTDADKVVIQAFSGNTKLREFNMGQSAPTFKHTFVSLAGDPNVYHAQGAFVNTFNKTVEELRDKSVMTFDRAAVTTVEIQKGDQTLVAAKTEAAPEDQAPPQGADAPAEPKVAEWRTTQGDLLNQKPLEDLMRTLSGLKCDSFVSDHSKADFTSALWSVTFKDAANAYTLSLFAKQNEDDTRYPAVSSTSPYVFTLLQGRVETLEKQLDQLMKHEDKE